MGEFLILAPHQSMAVVTLNPISLLILIHTIISCGDFWKINCIDTTKFETIADLKAAIQNKISIMKPTVLESVVKNFVNCSDRIIEKKGSHVEKYYCSFWEMYCYAVTCK